MSFYDHIREYIEEEGNDNMKYLELAKFAPNEKAKKILTDIAHEESIHRKFLQEILSEEPVKVSKGEHHLQGQSVHGSESYASDEIDYPDSIENTGIDSDNLEVMETVKTTKKG